MAEGGDSEGAPGVPLSEGDCPLSVGRSERWPLVGWLAAQGQTIFHQRGSSDSLSGVMELMAARLREGRSVGVFPEGRTRGGDEVGPFHARIFTAAVEAHVPVQPVLQPDKTITAGALRIVPLHAVTVNFVQMADDHSKGYRVELRNNAGCEFRVELRAQ